jgi:hypothetical protein
MTPIGMSSEAQEQLAGTDIAKILTSVGPIVKCVVLRAGDPVATNSTTTNGDTEDTKPGSAETNGTDDNNKKEGDRPSAANRSHGRD